MTDGGASAGRLLAAAAAPAEFLNRPPLVLAAGAALAWCGLPALERAVVEEGGGGGVAVTFPAVRILNSLSFALNVYATSRPGRIDGSGGGDGDGGRRPGGGREPTDSRMDAYRSDRRGRTLLAPAPWTFAIWGPIFIGELLFCIYGWFLTVASAGSSTSTVAVVSAASPGFVSAQLFQVLWTASFRPKYFSSGGATGTIYRYVSSFMLAGIAWSMGRAHAAYSAAGGRAVAAGGRRWERGMCFLPLALHFGWTVAATLVSWNGNVAGTAGVRSGVVAGLGHASAVAAAALGAAVTLSRRSPVFGLVISWALAGCASGMQERMRSITSVPPPPPPSRAGRTAKEKNAPLPRARAVRAAAADPADRAVKVQLYLCGLGALVNAATSLFVVIRDASNLKP
jgi:hypothetical protein